MINIRIDSDLSPEQLDRVDSEVKDIMAKLGVPRHGFKVSYKTGPSSEMAYVQVTGGQKTGRDASELIQKAIVRIAGVNTEGVFEGRQPEPVAKD